MYNISVADWISVVELPFQLGFVLLNNPVNIFLFNHIRWEPVALSTTGSLKSVLTQPVGEGMDVLEN